MPAIPLTLDRRHLGGTVGNELIGVLSFPEVESREL
jgi:hypothetical protein